jgi:hypothetical protein
MVRRARVGQLEREDVVLVGKGGELIVPRGQVAASGCRNAIRSFPEGR